MQYTRKKVLITIITYPHPSEVYQELVCTAGVLEDGSFIRLYPIDYRYQPYWQWYEKYQWIEVDVAKHERDPRKESWRPRLDSIKPIGDRIPSDNNWGKRKAFVFAKGTQTIEQLRDAYDTDYTSLGIVRPAEVLDFSYKSVSPNWKAGQQRALMQKRLFGPDQKPLEKIPFEFSYKFRCEEDRCRGHTMMIADWEVGRLYIRMRNKHGNSNRAAEDVRNKFLFQMCAPERDPHFFVGTVFPYNTWIILGVFWPKRFRNRLLFDLS